MSKRILQEVTITGLDFNDQLVPVKHIIGSPSETYNRLKIAYKNITRQVLIISETAENARGKTVYQENIYEIKCHVQCNHKFVIECMIY